jgi:DNA polymerase-3 subunit epsilon
MLQRWRHGRRCRRLGRACAQPVLRQYLLECGELSVDRLDNTPLIAVDLELTGLDKNRDAIVAIGWTQIDRGRIRMGSNRRLLIDPGRSVGSSAAIHELLDSEVARGETVEAGLEALFSAARGRAWLLHHAGLDIGFLRQACANWAGVVPGFIVLDTLRIEYRLRRRREVPVQQGDLRLGKIRALYGLPRYAAHDALNDALGAAELMLAIAARLEPSASLRLAPYLQFF